MKRLGNIGDKTIPLFFLALLVSLWQLIVDGGIIARYILPSPWDVVMVCIKILPDIKEHIYTTLQEALTGLVVAIVISVILAVLMDNFTLIRKAVQPLLVISQTIPIMVLAPLFAMWFGFGILPKIMVVILVCFFPIVVSLLEGLNSLDQDLLNLMKSMKANRWQIFYLAKFPSSLSSFFSGLKIAATYSIIGAVIGEWMGGKSGLGVYMTRVRQSFALDKVFASILIIIILSMILFKIIELIQFLVMPWRRAMNK
ncbi:MAG: ABC transporter permease [Atribacterota bacterium]|jgi:ABC-type nitrate/sulfonate/bicarbonate transport system permease component|nr:ABC transporter permease [Atribacterota bacterium]MDD5637918.1 ABC transporter permease [Atribacterota bacterium]